MVLEERVFCHVRPLAAETKLPVLADVEVDDLLIFPDGEVDGCFQQAFHSGFLERSYHQENVRPKSIQMAKVGFDILLDWCLSSGYRCCGRRLCLVRPRLRRDRTEQKNQGNA